MIVLFSCGPVSVRIRQVFPHTARRLVRNGYQFEYDGLRKHPMAEVAAVERHVFPFPELDALVEHQQFQLGVQEKPAWRYVVQPVVRHQQGERFSEFQATVENVHFPAERRIGHEHIPLGRLVFEEILSLADM